MLPRRADAVEVVAEALVAHADGEGHRPIAVGLGPPAATVRRFAARAGQTRQHAARWLIRLDVSGVRIEPARRNTGPGGAVPCSSQRHQWARPPAWPSTTAV